MKKKRIYFILALFAVFCAVLGAGQLSGEGLGGIPAFPFEQLGVFLRGMSLSGGAANVAAMIIYVILCLLPVILLLPAAKKRGFAPCDALLILLSAVLFGVMYLMVNPALLGGYRGAVFIPTMKAIMGGVCWSILVSYGVLRLLRSGSKADRAGSQRMLRAILVVMGFYFVAVAFGVCLADFVAALEEVREANTGYFSRLGTTYVFLTLQLIVSALPYVLDALVALRGAELLDAMAGDPYSGETLEKAERFSRFCVLSLKITVLASLVFNIMQIVFMKSLAVVSVSVNIPLTSIAFVLAALLLVRFMRENKELKDDNDLFI